MKRTYLLALALSLAMGSTAFGASSEDMPLLEWQPKTLLCRDFQKMEQAKVFLDGEEKVLRYLLLKDGQKILISLKDFTEIFDAEIVYPYQENSFRMDRMELYPKELEKTEIYPQNWRLGKLHIRQRIFEEDEGNAVASTKGVIFFSLREMAEKWGYDVAWERTQEGEKIMVNTPKPAKVALEAGYSPEWHTVAVTMTNQDERNFIYGYEFFLQKWDGCTWKRAKGNAEVCYAAGGWELPANGIPITAQRSLWQYGDGVRLDAGRYRICQDIWEKGQENGLRYTLTAEFDVG